MKSAERRKTTKRWNTKAADFRDTRTRGGHGVNCPVCVGAETLYRFGRDYLFGGAHGRVTRQVEAALSRSLDGNLTRTRWSELGGPRPQAITPSSVQYFPTLTSTDSRAACPSAWQVASRERLRERLMPRSRKRRWTCRNSKTHRLTSRLAAFWRSITQAHHSALGSDALIRGSWRCSS